MKRVHSEFGVPSPFRSDLDVAMSAALHVRSMVHGTSAEIRCFTTLPVNRARLLLPEPSLLTDTLPSFTAQVLKS